MFGRPFDNNRSIFLKHLEAPPGCEPGMEVLQTLSGIRIAEEIALFVNILRESVLPRRYVIVASAVTMQFGHPLGFLDLGRQALARHPQNLLDVLEPRRW